MTNTTTCDAGRQREQLTRDLADWLMAGFWPSAKAQRWWRRLRRLAKATGQTHDAVYNALRRDAAAIMVENREAATVYRATVTDTISREPVGRFTYSANSIEEARERGWRIAGRRFGNDIDVRIERLSK